MSKEIITYIVFGIALLLALIFDLGLLSKKNKEVTIHKAFQQTIFWVLLALAFGIFMWMEDGKQPALEYISAYLMEWSLSIDNIFVFILIFTSFTVKESILLTCVTDWNFNGDCFSDYFYNSWCCIGTSV